jgi:predicted ester cyclase
MGAAPTGKEVSLTGINFVRLEGGKIVESWGNSDQLGWMRQIGVVPAEVSF